MTTGAAGNGSGPRDAVPSAAAPPTPGTGSTGPLRRTVRILNPLGLHFRAADRFARAAKQYRCAVRVHNGDARADGKSLTDLILLVVFPGTDVVLEVDGDDAAVALDPLAEILAAPNGEDYTI